MKQEMMAKTLKFTNLKFNMLSNLFQFRPFGEKLPTTPENCFQSPCYTEQKVASIRGRSQRYHFPVIDINLFFWSSETIVVREVEETLFCSFVEDSPTRTDPTTSLLSFEWCSLLYLPQVHCYGG